jgi:hypothetical protein
MHTTAGGMTFSKIIAFHKPSLPKQFFRPFPLIAVPRAAVVWTVITHGNLLAWDVPLISQNL